MDENHGIYQKVGLGMEYEREREKLLQVDWDLIGRRDLIAIV